MIVFLSPQKNMLEKVATFFPMLTSITRFFIQKGLFLGKEKRKSYLQRISYLDFCLEKPQTFLSFFLIFFYKKKHYSTYISKKKKKNNNKMKQKTNTKPLTFLLILIRCYIIVGILLKYAICFLDETNSFQPCYIRFESTFIFICFTFCQKPYLLQTCNHIYQFCHLLPKIPMY